jgi:hypothetical protein
MSDIVEVIMARAVYKRRQEHDIIPYVPMWNDLPDATKGKFIAEQRAALEALWADGFHVVRQSLNTGIIHEKEKYKGEKD